FGLWAFHPSDVITACVRPISNPTALAFGGRGLGSTRTTNETKYRPALSRVIVRLLGSLGRGRLHLILSGASCLASVTTGCPGVPESLRRNALLVYSALCLLRFDLKEGNFDSPRKKRWYDVSRWRRACCTGTLDTSLSHAYSSSFFKAVSAFDVSP